VARIIHPIITKHTAFYPIGHVCMKMGLHNVCLRAAFTCIDGAERQHTDIQCYYKQVVLSDPFAFLVGIMTISKHVYCRTGGAAE
jgi:hypothetical protein